METSVVREVEVLYFRFKGCMMILNRGGHVLEHPIVGPSEDDDRVNEASKQTLSTPKLPSVVVEEMEILTRKINLNNSITSGFEKDHVVATLLAFHDAEYKLNGPLLVAWAVANGWVNKNIKKLKEYIRKINQGVRPRTRKPFPPEIIEELKSRLASQDED